MPAPPTVPAPPSLRDTIVAIIRRIEQEQPRLHWRKVKDLAVKEAREAHASST